MTTKSTKKGRIIAPLHAVIIEPASTDSEKTTERAYAECMKQINQLIRKEGRNNVRNLR